MMKSPPIDKLHEQFLLTEIEKLLPVGTFASLHWKEIGNEMNNRLNQWPDEDDEDDRQHLTKLLLSDSFNALKEFNKELPDRGSVGPQLNEVLINNPNLTQREKEAVTQYKRNTNNSGLISGEFALGNILVANGQITRPQLDNALRKQAKSGRKLGEELITAGHASHSEIETGLSMQRKLVAYALAASVGFSPVVATTAEAAQTSAAMGVSVTVVAHAKMQTVFQESQLKISKEDIARGFVEVASASRFSVSTNSRTGYLMEFYPIGDIFDSVQIGGLGSPVHIGADGGAIVQRGQLLASFTHELSFRFTLSQDVVPGNYPWPLQLSVRAL
jgi:hypothetical protein